MRARLRVRSWLKRLAIVLALLGVVFFLATLLTLRFGDRTLWPSAPGKATVTVYLISHGYHAGVIVPRTLVAEIADRNGHAALGVVARRFADYSWLEIGWGDEGFYTQAPTLASVTVSLALRALFRPGNPSVLHVVGVPSEARTMFPRSDIVRLDLSELGFARLLAKIDATFARNGERLPEELGAGLYGPSLFYRAVGMFSIFNVCNHWTADLLDAAGIPTAPVLATLPDGLLFDLKWRSGLLPLPRAAP